MRRLCEIWVSGQLYGLKDVTQMECKTEESQVELNRQPIFHLGLVTLRKASQIVPPARAICHESAILAEGIVAECDSAI